MAKMTETAIRTNLTTEAVAKLITVLTEAGYDVTRTNDLQTITFPVGQVDNGTKNYTAYGSIKFTLRKGDFDLTAAEDEYELLVDEREMKSKERAEKKAKAEADKAARAAKREAAKA